MRAEELIAMIPDKLLEDLSIETGVDKYSKKLQGKLLFKLLIYSIVSYKDNSLRKMETAYESLAFGLINSEAGGKQVKFNSISERLKSIDASYFRKIYAFCTDIYSSICQDTSTKKQIILFDSTIVTLSSKLLFEGYNIEGSSKNLKQIKYTIGFDKIPKHVDLYTERIYTSENAALKETILSYTCDKNNPIRVFDRGISARKTYDELSHEKIPFVSRINIACKKEYVSNNLIAEPIETQSLRILKESIVYLYNEKGVKTKYPIRYIEALQKDNQKEIHFISNIFDLAPSEITNIYKQRWNIECFFKFIKQELNFSHLVNRSKNGIEIMLYATLIAATLILCYKEVNKLKGFKITKQKFTQDLEKSIAITLVGMCGGDVIKAAKILNIDST